jgi:hypothetical protein
MRSVPRSVLRRAGWYALAVVVLGPALGACASTVTGHGTIDAAAASTAPTDPSTSDSPTTTDEPSESPVDSPSASPSSSGSAGPVGSSEDRQAVAGLAEAFYHGVAAKDGERVCAMLTASARREAAEDSKDCPTSLREADLTAAEIAALSNVKVDPEGVQVTGGSATVPASATTVNGQSTTDTGNMKLLREGVEWKVDDIE